MLAIGCDSRTQIDEMNTAAEANGGTADVNPKQDQSFMYSRSLADPGGHIWEPMWMDISAMPAAE